MKTTLIISVICAVAAAAPAVSFHIEYSWLLRPSSSYHADIRRLIQSNGVINILDGSNVQVDGVLSNDKILQTRGENPIVDILDNGEVKAIDNAKDINVGQGLVSHLKKETRDDKLPTVASVLKNGGGVVANNAKDINIARDNSVVDILQGGTGIVANNANDIDIL
jgi:hypothetical protein